MNYYNNYYYFLYVARDYDGKMTPEEVASAAMYLKDTLGKEGIQELISNLSKDKGQWQDFSFLECFLQLSNFFYYISGHLSTPSGGTIYMS